MSPQIATFVFVSGMIGLFVFSRERGYRFSPALFLPLTWLWLTSSRSITEWVAILQYGRPPVVDQAKSYMAGTPLDRNVLIGMMLLAVIVLVRRRKLGALLRANLPITLFLVYALMSVMWSDFQDVTIRRWFKDVGCVLMIMVVLSDRDRAAATWTVMAWAGFLLIPHSILLIKYYPAVGRHYNRWTWLVSYVGVTTHKNSLGGICQAYGTAFFWFFLRAYRGRRRPKGYRQVVAYGVALGMVAYLFWLANSVTAQSTFALAAAFLLATNFRSIAKREWMVHVIIVVLIAVPFATLFMGIGGGALEGMGRDSTLTGRTDIWPRVIALVHNPILGTGFESFWLGSRLETMNRYQKGLNETHNGYLEIWVSLGWIGVLLLAAMIVKGYRVIMELYRRDPVAGRFRLAFFLTVIVSSFTEAAFRTESISWIAFLLITMSGPDDRLGRSRQEKIKTAATEQRAPGQELVTSGLGWSTPR